MTDMTLVLTAAVPAPAKAIVSGSRWNHPQEEDGSIYFAGNVPSSCQTMPSSFTKPEREFDPRNMWKKVKGEGQIMPQRADEGGKGRMQAG